MSDVTSIPGVATVHPRSSWVDPRYPVSGPPALTGAIDTCVIHYTSALKIPADIAAYHRSMQRDYTVNRGYSLGYRWSVTQSGEVYQIRGWDLKSAANANHNDHTEPILVLVDAANPATPAACASIRAIIAESQRRSGRTFAITGHGQLAGAATACPGVGLRTQIAAGVFTPVPAPPPPTITDEVDMIAIDHQPGTPEWTALTYTGSQLAHVSNGHADAVIRRAGVQRQTVTDAELDALIRSAQTTTPCPPAWVNTSRGAAWTSSRG
jgi:hypothetical protein